jgi:hypothetical protein
MGSPVYKSISDRHCQVRAFPALWPVHQLLKATARSGGHSVEIAGPFQSKKLVGREWSSVWITKDLHYSVVRGMYKRSKGKTQGQLLSRVIMSLIFDALQLSEGKRSGFESADLPQGPELLRRAERRAASKWKDSTAAEQTQAATAITLDPFQDDRIAVNNQQGVNESRPPKAGRVDEKAEAFSRSTSRDEQPGAIESLFSAGTSGCHPPPSQRGSVNRLGSITAPGRSLPSAAPVEEPSSLQRVMNILRVAVPIAQRILPLLDRRARPAVADPLVSGQHPQPAALPAKVDLAPLRSGMAELQTQHRNLREDVMERNASLKRVEERLQMVREATDRNTLEQQELLGGLRIISNKIRVIVVIAIGLLTFGLLLNLTMFVHLQRAGP